MEKKGFKKLINPDTALKMFMEKIAYFPKRTEFIKIDEALGRVLSKDLVSPVDIPPFNRAAMDGYAVRSIDVTGASESNPIRLKVIGESLTGKPFHGKIGEGEAVRIDTGAEMPEGADAVVMVEYTRRVGNYVDIYKSVGPNQNVALKGEDVKKGGIVAYAGIPLTPYDIAAIASLSIKKVEVYIKPKVAIAAIGNELVDIGNEPDRGQIIETNRLLIKGILKKYPVEIIDYGIIKDDINILTKFYMDAIKKCDIVITAGGTSMGKGDLVRKVVDQVGDVIVHGVALYPARPVLMGIINNKPILGLPGYPVAAAISMYVFGEQIIASLCGIKGHYIAHVYKGTVTKRVPSRLGLRHYARGKLVYKDGSFIIEPVILGGAGILTSLSLSDGYIVVPEDKEGFESGEEIDIILYRRYVKG